MTAFEYIATTGSMLRKLDPLWGARAWANHPSHPPEGWMQAQCQSAAALIDQALAAQDARPAEFDGPVHNFPTTDGEPVTDAFALAELTRRWVQRALDEVEGDFPLASGEAAECLAAARQRLQAVLNEFE